MYREDTSGGDADALGRRPDGDQRRVGSSD